MKPETIQKLRENVPEFRELLAFLASEAAKLDSLSILDKTLTPDLGAHIVGLRYARDTINAMLAPLLETVDKPTGVNPAEYMIE